MSDMTATSPTSASTVIKLSISQTKRLVSVIAVALAAVVVFVVSHYMPLQFLRSLITYSCLVIFASAVGEIWYQIAFRKSAIAIDEFGFSLTGSRGHDRRIPWEQIRSISRGTTFFNPVIVILLMKPFPVKRGLSAIAYVNKPPDNAKLEIPLMAASMPAEHIETLMRQRWLARVSMAHQDLPVV